jgi:chromosome segregation ATPase
MSAIFAEQLASALADRDQANAVERAEMKRAIETAATSKMEQEVMSAIQQTTADVTRAAAESMQDSVRTSVLSTTHELTVTHCNEVTALKNDYDEQLRQKTGEIVELDAKKTNLEHDLVDLHKAKTALEQQFNKKLAEEQKKSSRLKQQLDDSKAEVKSLNETSQSLQKQLAQVQAKLASEQAKSASLDCELREQIVSKEGLESKVTKIQAENLKLTTENEQKDQTLKKSSREQTALEGRIGALKEELEAARKETMKALEMDQQHEAAIERASLNSGSARSSEPDDEIDERRLAAGEEMLKVTEATLEGMQNQQHALEKRKASVQMTYDHLKTEVNRTKSERTPTKDGSMREGRTPVKEAPGTESAGSPTRVPPSSGDSSSSGVDYAALLTEIYQEHNPEKLTDPAFVANTLLRYAGREKDLIAALNRKYGLGPASPAGGASSPDASR